MTKRLTSPATLAAVAAVAIVVGYGMVFFYAPLDADQGFVQKIFYLHVPLAICALVGFMVAACFAIAYLRTEKSVWDARAYVTIHQSVIFALAVLVTGSIWAKAAWGKWWIWEEPTLVSFLIIFLLYATYYPLRYSIDDPQRQARYASVFALVAGAFVPLNFMAVRLAESLVHPRTFATAEGGLPGSMLITFLVCLVGVTTLFVALVRFELEAKRTAARISRLGRRLAASGSPVRRATATSTGLSAASEAPHGRDGNS